jgi:hypothetical protein
MSTGTGASASHRGGLTWRKSSYSTPQGECVEVATLPGGDTAVRDSRQRPGPNLVLTRAAWRTFCNAIKTGALDRA